VTGNVLKQPGNSVDYSENAVVVPVSRAIKSGKGAEWGTERGDAGDRQISDEKTELSLALKTCSGSFFETWTRRAGGRVLNAARVVHS